MLKTQVRQTISLQAPASDAPYALSMLTAMYAMSYADRGIINLLLDPIKAEFRLTDTSLGLLTGFGFVFFNVALSLPIARLADKVNRVNILAAGLFLWSTMTTLSGFATSAAQLVIARLGVGAGEACGIAPAHALLADYYTKEKRPRIFGVLTSGGDIGIILGFLIGGVVSQYYGWRTAFVVAGVPGILLAIVFRLTVKEPVRGASEEGGAKIEVRPLGETASFLLTQKSYLLTILGGTLMGLHLFPMQVWAPTFLRRVHHLNSAQIGIYSAFVRTAVSILGAVLGGVITEQLGKKSDLWRLRVPAIACALSTPFVLLFLFVRSTPLTFVFLGASAMMVGAHLGPCFAMCQTVSRSGMRAVASAVFVFTTNLIGLGLGSLLVGTLSDHLRPHYGDLSIRYSMMAPAFFGLFAGIAFWSGSRFVRKDIARVAQA